MRKVVFGFILCCPIVIGCAIGRWESDNTPLSIEDYQARYSNCCNSWVLRPVEELIALRGPPDDILEAKPRWTQFSHGIHVLSYIYYNRSTDNRSCIDTFVVVEDTGTIIKYYCR